MSKMNPNEKKENASKNENVNNEEATNLQEEQSNAADETAGSDNVSGEVEALQKKYNELNDSHLRLMAEFDNYRKRTMREKADLIKTGGEGALKNLLPIIDDFERALQNVRTAEDVEAVKEKILPIVDNFERGLNTIPEDAKGTAFAEGMEKIYKQFVKTLDDLGVKPIEAIGKPFNTEEFEAIATIPAPEPDMKGKVLDCVQTGYTLFDKVIRHAKVVVGE